MNMQKEMYIEHERKIPFYGEFDVIVVGAGLAGCCAAVCAGRQGVKTLLIERSGMIGGVATASMMASITNFFFNNKNEQIIKGIPEEVVDGLVKEGATIPDWRDYKVPQIPHDADILQIILFRMLKEAGVHILLHTFVSDVIVESFGPDSHKLLKGLIIENKTGRQAIYGKTTVDCSGDADVAYYAGVPIQYPVKDFATMVFEMGNVDLQKTFEYYKEHREDFDEEADVALKFSDFEFNWEVRGLFHSPHHGGLNNRLLQNAIKEGKYSRDKGMAYGLDALGLYGVKKTKKVIVNSNFYNIDTIGNLEQVSMAELEGRERCVELGRLLVNIMPGFENAYITRIASEIGSRVTRNIIGEYYITEEDFFNVKKFEDAVCWTPSIELTSKGCRVGGSKFGITYRAFLPRGIDNLLIGSGKCISAELGVRLKSLRAQVNTMLIGETAGRAAALAVKEGKTTRTIDIKKLVNADL